MDRNKIGSLEVSAVGLGCNNFGWHIDEQASARVVEAALGAGVNHFDTADMYGDGSSEEFLGRALGARRDEVVIATKFGQGYSAGAGGAAPEYVEQAVEASLKRLSTDRIDLYYLHKPDPDTPIADTLGALSSAVEAGKVREIACSNFSPEQLTEAEKAAGSGVRFVAVQNEYSLLHREPEEGVLQKCGELDLALIPFFPLKSGLLTGKYRKGAIPDDGRLSGQPGSFFEKRANETLTEANLAAVEKLIAFAESRNHSILDLAFAWLLAHGSVASVIAGATKPAQIEQNVIAADWRLTPEDLAEIDNLQI